MEARSRFFRSPTIALAEDEEDSVTVLMVLVEEIVEAVAVVAAAAFAGRPLGDFFAGGVVVVSVFDLFTSLDCFLGLFCVAAGGGFSSLRLADFGRPRPGLLVVVVVVGLSSMMGEGLRLRPGDLRVPRRVATSWLDARVVRLFSIMHEGCWCRWVADCSEITRGGVSF